MRTAAARPLLSQYRVVLVATDDLVSPEARAHLTSDYDLRQLLSWDELVALTIKQLPDAIVLDIDTVGQRSEDGISALAQLSSHRPDPLWQSQSTSPSIGSWRR